MFLEVYPDVIFILNFILDFIILTLLKIVNRKKSSIKRRILAAIIGAIAAVIIGIFPWLNIVIRFFIINVVAAVLMLRIAFERAKVLDFMKQLIALYLLTYVIGGLMNSIYYNTNARIHFIRIGKLIIYQEITWVFIAAMIFIIVPVTILFHRLFRLYQSNNREIFQIELTYRNKKVSTTGFLDSGNCLFDPILHKPVIIMEYGVLNDLFTPELKREFDYVKDEFEGKKVSSSERNLEKAHELNVRIIPFQSIGKQQGMMLAVLLDQVFIHKDSENICNEKVTAAICDNRLSSKGDYHVILHKGIC